MRHLLLPLLLGLAVALTGCDQPDRNDMPQQGQEPEQNVPPGEPDEETSPPPEEGQAEPATIPAPDNVAAAPQDAIVTDSGIAYLVLNDAAGDVHPTVEDTVVVHYTGWTTDGKMFDSSVLRDQAATFPLSELIPGWQQAVPLMTVGDKYRFWIPGELAYDNSTRPGTPKGTLVFDIELLGVKQAAMQPTD